MLEKPSKLRAALLGGLIIGAISGVPVLNLLNCCCCAGILFGGAISVYLYRQEFTDEMPPLESSDALILGIIAGIIGAIITAFLSFIINLIIGPVEIEMARGFVEKLIQKLENNGSLPSSEIDNIREQLDKSMKENGTIVGVLSNLFFDLIRCPIFSLLGGLIGYGIFGKKKTTAPPLH